MFRRGGHSVCDSDPPPPAPGAVHIVHQRRLTSSLTKPSLADRSKPRVSFVPQLALGAQPLVEQAELPQEAVVGPDLPPPPHHGQGGVDGHVLAEHQVGDDQGGRAAVALPAVDVDSTCGRKQTSRGHRSRGGGAAVTL